MKSLIESLLREALDGIKCHKINITQEIFDEVNKFNTDEELLRSGGISIGALDRAAFGFAADDIKTLMPKQLYIKWKDDFMNVEYEQVHSKLSPHDYAIKISLEEPIDVIYEKDRFYTDYCIHNIYE